MSGSQLPPIQKRSSSTAGSDLSGEITIDQFLAKYSKISSNHPAAPRYVSGLQSSSTRQTGSRRTSIRRQLACSRPDESVSPRASEAAPSPFRRSEQALLMTEHSSVLVSGLQARDSSAVECLSTGDFSPQCYTEERPDWLGSKFQQSPSPDNRYGDKMPLRERKSLLERWEDTQEVQRRANDWSEAFPGTKQPDTFATVVTGASARHLSTAGSSDDSQFDDDAYPYRRSADTRGSSQETGFEPTSLEEAALRPHSGVDSLSTPRKRPRTASSSGTEPSSAYSELSEPPPTSQKQQHQHQQQQPGGSLFQTGNVELMDDVVAMLSAKPPPSVVTPRSRSSPEAEPEPTDWDQADRASRPVRDKPRFPEPVRPAGTADTDNEYERFGCGAAPLPRASSHTQVMERLSQIVYSHRQRTAAVVIQAAPHASDVGAPPAASAAGPRPGAGRAKGAVPSPRPLGTRMPLLGTPMRRASDAGGLSPCLLGARPLPTRWQRGTGRRELPHRLPTAAEGPAQGSRSSLPAAVVCREPPALARANSPGLVEAATVSGGVSSASSSSVEMIPCLEDVPTPAEATASAASSPQSDTTEATSSSSAEQENVAISRDSAEATEAEMAPAPNGQQMATVDLYSARTDDLRLPEGTDDPVDVTMTQLLVWRQVLKWTAVSSTLLTMLAVTVFLAFLLL